jgi:hypothetical protein
MYSETTTQHHIERVEAELKIQLIQYEPDQVLAFRKHLEHKQDLKQPFNQEEADFIQNEQILCKLSFLYFANRYCYLIKDGVDGGGLGVLKLWESQKAVLKLIATLEEQCWEAQGRGEPVDGILIVLNKARQLGATLISRSIIMHRLIFWDHMRGFSASVDEDKVLELYERDKRIYDNLPFYLKPQIGFDKKADHLTFSKLDSGILYQHGKQQSGLGQGRQFEVSHFTEAASFPYPRMLEHDYFPTIPQSPWAFCLAESTPQGRGNWWHTWSEKVRRGRMARWSYLFVPVYIEPKKYRRKPPENWVPQTLTLEYARKVGETSPRVIGRVFEPEREHIYWWESTRQEYLEMGSLSIFLTNYAATPEESFQFSTAGALNPELLEQLRNTVSEPVSYEFDRVL